jgi:hypothetical protein
MNEIMGVEVDEDEFLRHLKLWAMSSRSLITLPVITQNKLQLKLTFVSIDNTKRFVLSRPFYTYESILGYYGRLIDRLDIQD